MSFAAEYIKSLSSKKASSDLQSTDDGLPFDHDYQAADIIHQDDTDPQSEKAGPLLEFLSVDEYEGPVEVESASSFKPIQHWCKENQIEKKAMAGLLEIVTNMFPPNSEIVLVSSDERQYKSELLELILGKLEDNERTMDGLCTKIDALKKEVVELRAEQTLRDLTYTKDLNALKKAACVKTVPKKQFPITNNHDFQAMERRMAEDDAYKIGLEVHFTTMLNQQLSELFSEDVMHQFSLMGRGELISLRKSALMMEIARSWSIIQNRSQELVLSDMDKELSRSRHRKTSRNGCRRRRHKPSLANYEVDEGTSQGS